MRDLVSEYWSSFYEETSSGNKRFNGHKFEELVRILLADHFEGNWDSTSITWDGGRDFVDRSILGFESWAECKMYSKALTIQTISNTLVMAVLHQHINKILIFSYSSLNKNAIQHLGNFSLITDIDVQVFDDELLEGLIFRSQNCMKLFFPKVKSIHNDDSLKFDIFGHFTQDPQIDYLQIQYIANHIKRRYPKIAAKTPCLLEFFIKSSNVSKTINVTIDLSGLLKIKKELGILNIDSLHTNPNGLIKRTYQPGQIKSVKIYMAPIKIGRLTIPEIPFTVNRNVIHNLPKIDLDITRINHPPIIGSNMLNALKRFENRISCNNLGIISVVSGRTGVGKSRYIKEAHKILLKQNYVTIILDGNMRFCQTHSSFIKILLARIWRLPDPVFINSKSKNAEWDKYPLNKSSSPFDMVCQYIYGDKLDTNPNEEYSDISQMITTGIKQHRSALMIDNIQALSSESIHMIEDIISKIQGSSSQTSIVLTFNEDDLIFSETAAMFHSKLQKQLTDIDECFFYDELTDFTFEQSVLFIDSLLLVSNGFEMVPFSNRYPRITKLIQENVLPRPLDLFQVVKLAEDKGIVEPRKHLFWVNDPKSLISLIDGLGCKTEKIFENRLSELTKSKVNARIILILAHMGDVERFILSDNDEDKTSVDILISAGILSTTDGDSRIQFYHPSIEKYVVKCCLHRSDFFPDTVREMALFQFENSNYSRVFPLVYFALSYRINDNPSEKIIIPAIQLLSKFSNIAPKPSLRLIISTIHQYLLSKKNILPIENYIGSIETICRFVSTSSEELGINYELYRNSLAKYQPTTLQSGLALNWIIRQIASYAQINGKSEYGNDVLVFELNQLQFIFNKLQTDTISRIKADFLNRRCVCLKSFGRFAEAESVGKMAFRIAVNIQEHDIACLSLIDLGYIYYGYKKDNNQLLEFWSQAANYFETHKSTIIRKNPHMLYAGLLVSTIVKTLKNISSNSLSLLEEMIQQCRISGNSYYFAQGLLTKGVILLRNDWEKHNYIKTSTAKYVLRIANTVEDLAISTGLVKFQKTAIILAAKACEFLSINDGVIDRYEVLLSNIGKPFDEKSKKINLTIQEEYVICSALTFWKMNQIDKPFPTSPMFIQNNITEENLYSINNNSYASTFSLPGINLPLP
jgi:hypothetical protein